VEKVLVEYSVDGAGTDVTWVHGQSVIVKVVALVTVYVFEPWTTVVGTGQ